MHGRSPVLDGRDRSGEVESGNGAEGDADDLAQQLEGAGQAAQGDACVIKDDSQALHHAAVADELVRDLHGVGQTSPRLAEAVDLLFAGAESVGKALLEGGEEVPRHQVAGLHELGKLLLGDAEALGSNGQSAGKRVSDLLPELLHAHSSFVCDLT